MRPAEAITFSVSSRSIAPMMDMFGCTMTMSLDSLTAMYWWPVTFSMYQVSALSAMKMPEPAFAPAVS